MSNVRFAHFTDGEGADYTDLNAWRDYQRALDGDMRLGGLLHRSSPYDFVDPSPHPSYLYASGVGGCAGPGAGARQITNVGGLIHHYTSTAVPDGASPVMHSYWLAGAELLTTLAVGDATNPRIDLIEIKLDILDESATRDFEDSATGVVTSASGVTRKKVRLTKNVVAGTPSATPALPTSTSGYVPWCYVWVPATHNAVFTDAEVSDLRYPLGFSRAFVAANNGGVTGAHWPLTAYYRSSTAGSQVCYFMCPVVDHAVRLIKVYAHASANVDINVDKLGLNGVAAVVLASRTNVLESLPAAPSGAVLPSATRPMAWWCSGHGHGSSLGFGTQNISGVLVEVISRAAGTDLYGVSFELAGTV